MSHSNKPLAQQAFRFGGAELRVWCRRLPGEVSRVTQTLQLDVEELFASLLDWDTTPAPEQPPEPAPDQQQQQPEQQGGQQQQQGQQQAGGAAGGAAEPGADPPPQQGPPPQRPDSKQLCGGVASDQPDLVGLDVWPAAVALCTYLAAAPALAAGAAVCELGAGMGLPGLLCAKLGAARVLLTDYEPVVVEQLARNAELNDVAPRCATLALDWFDLAPLAPPQRAAWDLLLLADVIYAAAVVGPLVQTLLALLKPESGVALVAHRIRRPLVFDRMEKIAKLQERDEIFEEFQAACRAQGLHLRFLNGDSPAAQAGDEPLLLVIGPSPQHLQRFPAVGGADGAAAAAISSSAAVEAQG